ncbi:MAG: M56 family metallopeptidase, partial [bacterium]|nr:M56 family metallopeptidase [bacterium]
LNLIVLAGLFKLVLPVMNINPLSDTTLSNLTNYIYPEIIFRSTEAISADASMSAISIIFLTWIAGIILIAGLILVNQIKIYGIISRSESMEVNGISYDIEVFRSAEIFSPFTTGLFRKRILLPEDWNDISSECKKAVLAHEVAHVNNLDNWLNLIRRLILVVNFFNPVVILFLRKVNDVREILCDQYAIKNSSMTAKQYSGYLVDFAEKLSLSKNRMTLSLAFTESYKNLKNRIKYNLSGDLSKMTNRLSYKDITAIALVTTLMVPFSLKCTGEMISGIEPVQEKKNSNRALTDVLPQAANGAISNGYVQTLTFAPHAIVDEIPRFLPKENQPKMIGGSEALSRVLVYPEISLRGEIQGVVVVVFIVGKDGIPRDLKIAKSLNEECDKAALEGLKKMRFIPASQDSKPVAYRMSRPIRFLIK